MALIARESPAMPLVDSVGICFDRHMDMPLKSRFRLGLSFRLVGQTPRQRNRH